MLCNLNIDGIEIKEVNLEVSFQGDLQLGEYLIVGLTDTDKLIIAREKENPFHVPTHEIVEITGNINMMEVSPRNPLCFIKLRKLDDATRMILAEKIQPVLEQKQKDMESRFMEFMEAFS